MMYRLLPSILALVIATTVSALIVALAGGDPILALSALAAGAFGSVESWSEVGVKTCPLLLTGLAVALSFRAGIWNIGAEGQLLVGAVAIATVAKFSSVPDWCMLPVGLIAASAAGAAWAGVAGLLKTRRNVDEVISTIMLNFIAVGLIGYLVHGPLMEASGQYPQSDALPSAMRLPRLFSAFRAHGGLLIAFAAAALTWVLLFRTVLGYQLRAVGWNPAAARLAGVPISSKVFVSLALSGALAGLAGGIEVSAVTFRVYERFSPGYGFTAIAVALLGRLHPAGVVVAAFLFGALETGSSAMQRSAGVSSVLVSVIQAVVILSLIAADHRAIRPTSGWRG